MAKTNEGLSYYNYISTRHLRNILKGFPCEFNIKNIKQNEQIRGCSGFLKNTETGKVCYITTEPFFNGRRGSGLWGDKNKAIMCMAYDEETRKSGNNRFTSIEGIPDAFIALTTKGFF